MTEDARPLAGQVAIVTGAGRGIGRAIALAFGRAGAAVIVVARSTGDASRPGTIDHVAAEIVGAGGAARAVAADVTDPDQVRALVETTLERFGRIDLLVNNAALIGPNASFLDTSPAEWDAILTTNLRGAYLCSAAVAPVMARQRRGAILSLSSGAADRPGFLSVPYGVSKAALERLTLGLAHDLRDHGVAALAYRAAFTDTAATRSLYSPEQLASVRGPEDAARAILFLARDPLPYSGRVLTNRELAELGAFAGE